MFKKGQSGNPKGKVKGTLNKETLTKLERRAVFEKKISERWEAIIDQLPPTYIADQYLGKAPEKFKGEIITKPFDELPENKRIQTDTTDIQKD